MAQTPLFPVSAFILPASPRLGSGPDSEETQEITHVAAAGSSLPLKSHTDALTRYTLHKAAGSQGYAELQREVDETRALAAQAWGVQRDDIGFVSSVAEGVSILVESLDWKEGDTVYVDRDEFASVVAPFAVRGQRFNGGVVPKVVYGTEAFDGEGGGGGEEELEKKVDSQTRLIAVSYVSYLNGARVDLAAYRRAADRVGAILLVDYTQAAGYLPIDASVADFAFSASFKFLLGITGAAIAFWNRERQPEWKPATAGSYSLGNLIPDWEGEEQIKTRDTALCFSRGNPSHLSIYLLREGLEFLSQWEAKEIEEHVQILTTELWRRLDSEGIRSSTPKEKSKHGANVTVHCKGATEIVNKMSAAGILAWNGYGRVRFTFHGHNHIRDVDRIMEVFPPLWREWNTSE
ncbi:pyridoxal phosphate-dependent transferase [Aspergillus pseudoustus]|uniref:Pyridoxal phosphate-dependent transferase n=1 Tax=Aspergillus pseudoustus TaxID=1810923 RepID=A0ABR4KUJ1_9EURO